MNALPPNDAGRCEPPNEEATHVAMSSKRSRVHPTFKTKYRVGNWPEYDRGLVDRGDLTVWISHEAIDGWRATPSGARGGQRRFSDTAIKTALTLRLVLHLPLRQTEGFLRSLFVLMDLDLDAPDHTTLSRRARTLDVQLRRPASTGPIHLVIDSSGLSIVGEGEWAAAKHGARGKRGWRKLHLGVDAAGVIVAQTLTDGNADDATTGIQLIDDVTDDIALITADTAYDTLAIYDAAAGRGAQVVVPPTRNATVSRRRVPRCAPRDRTVKRVKEFGRRRWKRESGYHRQARVENAFFRYKQIIGPRLRARDRRAQEVEALLACNLLNRMSEIARPEISIGV